MCKGSSLLKRVAGMMVWMLSWCVAAHAQDEKHFVYIQSDQHQLFYVKMDDQIISANPPGYVVLSPVPPGKLDLIIGFPRNEYPEQRYQINMPAHQDKGYLLKRISDREFALYDLHQYTELKPIAVAEGQGFAYPVTMRDRQQASAVNKLQAKSPGPVKDTTPDADQVRFRQLLLAAATAGQPGESVSVAHAQKTNAETNKTKPETQPVAQTDSQQHAAVAKALYPPADSQAVTNPGLAQSPTENDTLMQPAQAQATGTDTSMEAILQKLRQIAAEIPSSRPDTSAHASLPLAAEQEPVTQPHSLNETAAQRPTDHQAQLQFIHFDTAAQHPASGQHIAMINSDCVHVLDEKQFDALKNKIAAQRNDAAMLRIVQRNLKNNCFTTHQVETLIYLFTTEAYRYRFVEWVYPHVADSDQFKQLGHIFPDEPYQSRFRSLIRQ